MSRYGLLTYKAIGFIQYTVPVSFICGYSIVALSIGAVTATYFPLFSFFAGVEVARAVKEEGPASVDYATVNGSVTLRSSFVAGQKDASRLQLTSSTAQCTAYEM